MDEAEGQKLLTADPQASAPFLFVCTPETRDHRGTTPSQRIPGTRTLNLQPYVAHTVRMHSSKGKPSVYLIFGAENGPLHLEAGTSRGGDERGIDQGWCGALETVRDP